MNRWPAYYRSLEGDSGTCYIDSGRFLPIFKYYNYAGQAWRFKNEFTTYRPNGKLLFKNLDRLATRDREDWQHIIGSCQAAGITPPTSFTKIFTDLTNFSFIRKSVIAPFVPLSFGGWQEVFQNSYKGRIYNYDINKAYRWAACLGLPDVKTTFVSKKWDLEHAIYNVELREGTLPYAPFSGLHTITSEERDYFKIVPIKILYGFGFRTQISLTKVFDRIDKEFPFCRDRICRAFWGIWNTQRGVEQMSWSDGEKHRFLGNPHYNPVWSAFITSRVKMRLAKYLKGALQIFVDAIMLPEEIETGFNVGDFKLKGVHEGVWFLNGNPGIWRDREGIKRHSGYTEEGLSKLQVISEKEYLKLRSDGVL